jgi:hypothetical protein
MFARTEDKIINTFYEVRFIDAFAFMAASIIKLSENLRNKNTDIKILRDSFKYTIQYFTNDDQFLEMIKKEVYPYDYIDDFNKLYTSYLPNIYDFD